MICFAQVNVLNVRPAGIVIGRSRALQLHIQHQVVLCGYLAVGEPLLGHGNAILLIAVSIDDFGAAAIRGDFSVILRLGNSLHKLGISNIHLRGVGRGDDLPYRSSLCSCVHNLLNRILALRQVRNGQSVMCGSGIFARRGCLIFQRKHAAVQSECGKRLLFQCTVRLISHIQCLGSRALAHCLADDYIELLFFCAIHDLAVDVLVIDDNILVDLQLALDDSIADCNLPDAVGVQIGCCKSFIRHIAIFVNIGCGVSVGSPHLYHIVMDPVPFVVLGQIVPCGNPSGQFTSACMRVRINRAVQRDIRDDSAVCIRQIMDLIGSGTVDCGFCTICGFGFLVVHGIPAQQTERNRGSGSRCISLVPILPFLRGLDAGLFNIVFIGQSGHIGNGPVIFGAGLLIDAGDSTGVGNFIVAFMRFGRKFDIRAIVVVGKGALQLLTAVGAGSVSHGHSVHNLYVGL